MPNQAKNYRRLPGVAIASLFALIAQATHANQIEPVEPEVAPYKTCAEVELTTVTSDEVEASAPTTTTQCRCTPPLVLEDNNCELPKQELTLLDWSAGDASLPHILYEALNQHKIDDYSVGVADENYDLVCNRRQMTPLNLYQYRCRLNFAGQSLPWSTDKNSLASQLFVAMRQAAKAESRGPKVALEGRGQRRLTCVSAAHGAGTRYSCELSL